MYAAGGLMVLAVAAYFWIRSYTTISVAPDTTVLTAPLLADGYPDYIAYLDAQNALGVKPEENAWIAILRCNGPSDIDQEKRAEHFRKLGIEPLPDQGLYLRPFYDTTRMNTVPEPVIIAASVAAQLPWHVRFARLAAINAYREANGPVYVPIDPAAPFGPGVSLDPDAPLELLPEHIGHLAEVTAQAAWDFADDPVSASAQWAFESNAAAAGNFDSDDEANIQDLRPEALAKIKPVFVLPEEEEEWRRGIFETARGKLLEREELIVSDRAWTREECPTAAYWVDCYSPLLDQLQGELLTRKKFYAPYIQKPGSASVVGGAMPMITYKRQLGMSYQARANLFLGEKNFPAALRDLTTILQIGALIPNHPTIVEGLVSIAVDGMAIAGLREIILSPETTDEQLAAIEQLLVQTTWNFDVVDCLDHCERLAAIGQVVATVARGDDTKLYYFGPREKIDHHWEQQARPLGFGPARDELALRSLPRRGQNAQLATHSPSRTILRNQSDQSKRTRSALQEPPVVFAAKYKNRSHEIELL